MQKQIREIGVEVTLEDMERIETFLQCAGIPFYVEPPNRFASLEDLECQCEGK